MSAPELRRHLAEITRDRLGRFASIRRLSSCSADGCSVAPGELRDVLERHDEFLGALDAFLGADELERAELAELVREFRRELAADAARIEAEGLELTDQHGRRRHLWVVGRGVAEVLDVTGLEGRDASALALALQRWNGVRKVYKRDASGQRRLEPGEWRVDLLSPVVIETGVADVLRQAIDEGLEVELRYDYSDELDPRERAGELEAELEAREAARAAA